MTAAPAAKRQFSKNDVFRWSRLIHGWLSAVAFLVLCFFSVTGLMLNHPAWFEGNSPAAVEQQFTLDADELARLNDASVPGEVLATLAAKRIDVRGDYSDGDLVGNEVFVRMQGVRGLTDVRANLTTGAVKAIIEPAKASSILNELHRAERAGVTWRWFVDVVAVLLIVLSIAGYVIFLSLRYRLRTALLLTAGSTIGVWALFVFAVH